MDVFRAMTAFVTTVKSGSMKAASVQMGISAAMVGQHIAALEHRLGMKLLNRTTRSHSLTDFGHSYLEQCKEILARVSASEEAAQSSHANPRGTLRITAPITFGAECLAPALGQYRQIAPEVTVDLVLTNRTVDLVDEGIDVAFRIGTPSDSRIIARPLSPYTMTLAASPSYLAEMGEPTHPLDLSAHQAIRLTQSAASWRFRRDQEHIEVTPRQQLTINNGRALLQAARAHLGVIMQPSFMLKDDLATGRLQALLPDWQLRQRPMSLVYYKDRHMTPRLRSFITFAASAFG